MPNQQNKICMNDCRLNCVDSNLNLICDCFCHKPMIVNTQNNSWEKRFDERFIGNGFTEEDSTYCEDSASLIMGCWKLKHIKSFISTLLKDFIAQTGNKDYNKRYDNNTLQKLPRKKEIKE